MFWNAFTYRVFQKKWYGVYFANISATKYRIFKSLFPPENWDPYANFEYKIAYVQFKGVKIFTKQNVVCDKDNRFELNFFSFHLSGIWKMIKIKINWKVFIQLGQPMASQGTSGALSASQESFRGQSVSLGSLRCCPNHYR